MMICSLLIFLGMFKSSKKAIHHYNTMRAVNMKALTICSQKRYVKFFEGFLNTRLFDKTVQQNKNKEMTESYFEKSLCSHNYLSFNRVFEDMKSESLELHTISMGPFPMKISNFNLDISLLIKQQEVKSIFSLNQWRQLNQDLEDIDVGKYIEWIYIDFTD